VTFKGKVSIVIPCYNEEEVIHQTSIRVKNVLEKSDLSSYEIIYINDGSQDGTLTILKDIAKSDKAVTIINFSRNFGHQSAVSAGIHYCTGDVAIIIDADMQDPPELFPDLLKTYQQEDCNVVYCVRKKRKGESFFKRITATFFYKILKKYSDISIPLDTGDFRLIDRKVITEFKKMKEKNKFIRGLIFWLGFKQVPFYYTREKREVGETKYPLKKMISFALTGLTYFTNKPLLWAFKIGILNLIIAVISVIFLVAFPTEIGISQQIVSGLLISIMLFFAGLNFFILGIFGIYLKNIFTELIDRPEYIIEGVING